MREKRLKYTTLASLMFQIVAVVCGFVLPRLLLDSYGSSVNGLVNSIAQFLGIINFMELGVGAVVQSALYEPLAVNDKDAVDSILKSGSNFYKKIAILLIAYTGVLLIVFPTLVNDSFEPLFTCFLILAMFISSLAQYYFGIVDRLLLTSDQKGYIQYIAQTITILVNTITSAILIKVGVGIIGVKLCTSIIFVGQPIFVRLYISKHYSIDRKVIISNEPIKQKWNGLAQHVAAVVLDSTDTIVLTIFSTLENVSIYSVYHLVIYGVKNLFTVITNGIQSYWGNMWAKKEYDQLKKSFNYFEWLIHNCVVLIFGCTGILIVPFVKVYTLGIDDINYTVPIFAALITIAHGCHCLRLPYHILIKAVGHYKQSEGNYIIAVILNVAISIATVKLWGLIGVAIGTLIAMLYQTIWMAWYDRKSVIYESLYGFIKILIVDLCCIVTGTFVSSFMNITQIDYFAWVILAIKVFFCWFVVILIFNMIFYRSNTMKFLKKISIVSKFKSV